jgi:hypothetical protein
VGDPCFRKEWKYGDRHFYLGFSILKQGKVRFFDRILIGLHQSTKGKESSSLPFA